MKPHLRDTPDKKRPSWLARLLYLAVVVGLGFGGYQLVMHPDTPLARQWNPIEPLHVTDPVTPLTGWKLERALASTQSCLAALEDVGRYRAMPDLESSDTCHIKGRIDLSRIGQAGMRPLETRCAIGLRLAMWETHALQPAARDLFGTSLSHIDHIGSYNCRRIRGSSNRWSTHATADAIDVSGFGLADGTQLRLIDDWDDGGPKGAFLRQARDSACDWFRVTLSPDYNRLHADHFHIQSSGWGTCR